MTTTSNCEPLRESMSAYIESDLPPDAAAALEAHVATCEACRRYLETLRETVALCRRAPRPCLGEDCVRRAVAAAREELVRRGLIAG